MPPPASSSSPRPGCGEGKSDALPTNATLSPHPTIGQTSFTEMPVVDPTDGTGRSFVREVTAIPTAQTTKQEDDKRTAPASGAFSRTSERTSESGAGPDNFPPPPSSSSSSSLAGPGRPRPAMSGTQVSKDENRRKKIVVRAVSGAGLILVFSTCVYMGHLYVCGIVALSEFLLFRELVKVRYNVYFTTIEDNIPLFRTTQWMWFSVAIFYTYGDFISEVIQSNPDLHYLVNYSQYLNPIAFGLYSATFVLTIATMQVGHIKFQLNQLCWTIVVLCLTVGQMKYIMHNIFNGLFW